MKVFSQLERAQFENLSSDPTPGVAGRVWYNTTQNIAKVDTGTIAIPISGKIETLAVDPSPGVAGRLFYNTVTNVLKVDTGAAIYVVSSRLEVLAVDPVAGTAGRIFYNSASQTLKYDTGAVIVTVATGGAFTIVTATPPTYNATVSDNVILVNSLSAVTTVNLPQASLISGRQYFIKKTDVSFNTVTIDGNASETIDGALTYLLETPNSVVCLVSDGVNWRVSTPAQPTSDHKNYIINGGFDCFQRAITSGPLVGASVGSYVADRFKYAHDNMDQLAVTVTQSTTVPTLAESKFNSSFALRVDCDTAETTQDADDRAQIVYVVEGFDYAQIKGRTVTLSFWVRSTKTGIHCVGFRNNGADRSYVAEYTVNASNVYEKKVITLPLNPVGGTDNFTNGSGLTISWALVVGSNFQTTANAWQTGNFIATANQVNSMDNSANDFILSQVQLYVGDSDKPFVRSGNSFAEELQMCRRYYEKSYNLTVLPAAVTAVGSITFRAISSGHLEPVQMVPKCATSVVRVYSPDTGSIDRWRDTTAGLDRVAGSLDIGQNTFHVSVTATVNQNAMRGHWTADCDF